MIQDTDCHENIKILRIKKLQSYYVQKTMNKLEVREIKNFHGNY